MFVRTVYVTGDPEHIETAIDALSIDARKMLEDQPGFRGMGLYAERELGKLLTETWWDSEQNRQASDDTMRDGRAALLEPFASSFALGNYDVVVLHQSQRPERGAGFRLARLEFEPAEADLATGTFRRLAQPRLQAIAGVIGVRLYVDRSRGRAEAGVTYTDRPALAASRSAQASVRAEVASEAHLTVRGVEEFEVVFVDARQP